MKWLLGVSIKGCVFEPTFVCRIRQFSHPNSTVKRESKLGYGCKGEVGCQFDSIFGLLFGWAFHRVLAEQRLGGFRGGAGRLWGGC